jgi:hypothetical protein
VRGSGPTRDEVEQCLRRMTLDPRAWKPDERSDMPIDSGAREANAIQTAYLRLDLVARRTPERTFGSCSGAIWTRASRCTARFPT